MANDARKIRFAPSGALHIAPAPSSSGTGGTVLPVDLGDGQTAPAGYKSLGYVDEGGVTLTPAVEIQAVNAWQSAAPVLNHVTGGSFSVKATLHESNRFVTELFWGAPWIEVKDDKGVGTGIWRLDISSVPELQEISLVVDWSQKAVRSRCIIPRAMISDRGAIQLSRKENTKFELTLSSLDYKGQLGYVLTNDDLGTAA